MCQNFPRIADEQAQQRIFRWREFHLRTVLAHDARRQVHFNRAAAEDGLRPLRLQDRHRPRRPCYLVVRIGKAQIESVITRRSAEELSLKKGDKVEVVIKSTEVMLDK